MAQDIVSSMFGLSPSEVDRQRQDQIDASALQYARLDPFQRASMGMYQAGAGLGRIGAGMLGLQDPAIAEAQARQAALSQIDPNDPNSYLKVAQATSDPKLRIQLVMAAKQQQAAALAEKEKQVKMKLDEAKAERELAMAERALRDPEAKITNLRRQFMEAYPTESEAQIAVRMQKYLEDEQTGKAKGAGVTVLPGQKDVADIPKFEGYVQNTIKPEMTTISAANSAMRALDLAIRENNSIAIQGAKAQIAKAFGDGNISRKEIEAAGVDASLVGGILDWVSGKAIGTPTLDTMRQMYRAMEALKAVATTRANMSISRMKKVGEMSGVKKEQLDVLLDFPELRVPNEASPVQPSGSQTRTLRSGAKITVTRTGG